MTVTLKVASGAIAALSSGGVTSFRVGHGHVGAEGTQPTSTYLASGSSQPVFTPAANANGTVALTMTTTTAGNSGTGTRADRCRHRQHHGQPGQRRAGHTMWR